MNEAERQICSRLKNFREQVNCSQRNFAVMLGVSHDRLASIEYGRTPLRMETAITVATLTGCNLFWLAEGTGPTFGPLPSPKIIGVISPQLLFSNAWKTTLKRSLRAGENNFAEGSTMNRSPDSADARSYLDEEVLGILSYLPPQFHWKFFAHMAKAGHNFVAINQAAIIKLKHEQKNNPQKSLRSVSLKSKSDGVKSEVQKLIACVKRQASKPGAKSELARQLGVAPARISEWLSEKKEPGGDYTLKMLRWVEQQERQK